VATERVTDHYRIRTTIDNWGDKRFVLERLVTRRFLWWQLAPEWTRITGSSNRQDLINTVEHLRAQPEYV
jgi:hypothetical protein